MGPRPVVPVVQLCTAPCSSGVAQRTVRGPGWAGGRRRLKEYAARCLSCGVADGVVHQVGPSGTAHGSSELVKAYTPRRGRPSCRNREHPTPPTVLGGEGGGLLHAAVTRAPLSPLTASSLDAPSPALLRPRAASESEADIVLRPSSARPPSARRRRPAGSEHAGARPSPFRSQRGRCVRRRPASRLRTLAGPAP